MPRITLKIDTETLRLAAPFRISGHVFETSDVVVVTLDDGTHCGRGEGAGVYYLNDDVAHMGAAIEAVRGEIEAGPTRAALRDILPPGGARNAIDCALWELESQTHRQAGMGTRRPGRTQAAAHNLHAWRRRSRRSWLQARGATPMRARSRSS